MDSKAAASILERVKREREKRATVSGPVPEVLASGIGGGVTGAQIGALAGAGYGTAKGRPIAGTGRGLVRGGLTGAGVFGGGTAAANIAEAAGGSQRAQAIAGLLGALGGGVLGWRGSDRLIGKDMEEKRGNSFVDPSAAAFSDALQGMASTQLKSDAMGDVRNIGLASLGVGAAGRGLVGLIQMMKANKPKKTRSGPAYLPLPYPAEAKTAADKQANFLGGDMATTKGGIPWYGPAMLMGGLGGLTLGWKGMDKVLDARREKEQEGELVKAREQFHDALLDQYDQPIKTHPALMKRTKKAGDESTMEKVGKALDALYDAFEAGKEQEEKVAVDWSNLAGQAAGGYGMYAGLSGLLTGALVYDKINKRSRRAILEKALQQRQRRKFMQQPTEIMAVPEPMPAAA